MKVRKVLREPLFGHRHRHFTYVPFSVTETFFHLDHPTIFLVYSWIKILVDDGKPVHMMYATGKSIMCFPVYYCVLLLYWELPEWLEYCSVKSLDQCSQRVFAYSYNQHFPLGTELKRLTVELQYFNSKATKVVLSHKFVPQVVTLQPNNDSKSMTEVHWYEMEITPLSVQCWSMFLT